MDPQVQDAREGADVPGVEVRALRVVQYIAAVVAGSVALVSLVGWLSGALVLASVDAAYVPMAPVTALVFVALTGTLIFRFRAKPGRGRPFVLTVSAAVCGVMALELLDIATGLPVAADRLFLAEPASAVAQQSGRISPVTAVAFILLAGALALFESSRQERRSIATFLALFVTGAAFVLLVGYAYDVPLLYGGDLMPVALPTSIALLLVGVAVAGIGTDCWPLRIFVGDSIRARMSRILVPLAAAPMLAVVTIDAVTYRIGLHEDPVLLSVFFLVSLILVTSVVFAVTSSTGHQLDEAERTLRRREQQLRDRTAELERSNRELQEFAYVASHDLQEPLRMVGSYTQLLQRRYQGKLDADADDFIGFAVDGVNRMQTLIEELLAYSRVGTQGAPFRSADLDVVLAEALKSMEVAIADAGATVTVEKMPTLACDPNQIRRVFQNLIGNALKFRCADPPTIHIGACKRENDWLFSVKDNGIGIEPQYFDRVFTIFQRLQSASQYPGTGMGLSICKRIVERHGGTIWVESAPGAGSTFLFTLPDSLPEGEPAVAATRPGA